MGKPLHAGLSRGSGPLGLDREQCIFCPCGIGEIKVSVHTTVTLANVTVQKRIIALFGFSLILGDFGGYISSGFYD
jgi:hypothetical protein